MRLLAFGGTRYGERATVGEWPSLPDGDLSDTTRLPYGRGLLTFGCGVIGSGPCVILRQRQSEQDRGGYAYTLLLDPGTALWEMFRWNGAAIIASVLSDSELRPLALERPEQLAAQPAGFLERLASQGGQTAARETTIEAFADALAASLLTEAPLVLSAAALRLRSRPGPHDLVATFESLPVCLRGVGWLIGASTHAAETFGARVVLDDDDAAATTESGPDGGPVRHAVTGFAATGTPSRAGRLANAPAWSWSHPSSIVMRQFRLLHDATASNRLTIELSQASEAAELIGEPLGEEILQAFVTLLERATAPWSVAASEVATRLWLRDGRQLPERFITAIDPNVIDRWLQAQRTWPDAEEIRNAPLTPGQWSSLWRAAIRRSEAVGEQVAMLERAFRCHGDPLPGWLIDVGVELARAHIEAGTPLAAWFPKRDAAAPPTEILETLKRGARYRIPAARDPLEYLLFGNDPGGGWLAGAHAGRCEAAAREMLALLEGKQGYETEARDWLRAAAESPARACFGLDLKLAIAAAAGGQWSGLSALSDALEGRRSPAQLGRGEAVPAPDVAELIGRVDPNVGDPIDLETIATLAGDQLANTERLLAGGRIKHPSVVARNLRWLEAHGRGEALRASIVEAWSDPAQPPPPVECLPPEAVGDVVRALIDASNPTGIAARLSALIFSEDPRRANDATSALVAAVEAYVRQFATAGRVFSLMAADPRLLDHVFKNSSHEIGARLLDGAGRVKPSQLCGVAASVWQEPGSRAWPHTALAMARFILSSDGRDTLCDLAYVVGAPAAKLRRQFARVVEPAGTDGEAPQPSRFLARAMAKWRRPKEKDGR